MAERPILFSAPMLRALLAGTKTQTRRIIKPRSRYSIFALDHEGRPEWTDGYVMDPGNAEWRARDLAYAVGDRLWVREAWKTHAAYDDLSPSEMSSDEPVQYQADGGHQTWGYPAISKIGRSRPGIFMPRWASRLTLVVTDVRVQRLQEISEEDAKAEGAPELDGCDHARFLCDEIGCYGSGYRGGFSFIWSEINDRESWAANQWVAAYTFEVHRCNVDAMTCRAEMKEQMRECGR